MSELRVPCPFTVIVDSDEKLAYQFAGLRTNKDRGAALIDVPTVRRKLPTGDYSIDGLPSVTIERKTLSDFYASVGRRANFEARLNRMGAFGYAAVVVEAEWSEVLTAPPPRTRRSPKSVARTVMAWTQRFPTVHWWFMPGRAAGEALTFRLMERWWLDHHEIRGGGMTGPATSDNTHRS